MRNFLFKLARELPADGYHVGVAIDGVNRSEVRNDIADELIKMGCLQQGWVAVGRNRIQGQFNVDAIKRIAGSGKIE